MKFIYLGPRISISSYIARIFIFNAEKMMRKVFLFLEISSGHKLCKTNSFRKRTFYFHSSSLSWQKNKKEKLFTTSGLNHTYFFSEGFNHYEKKMKKNDVIGLAIIPLLKFLPIQKCFQRNY